MSQHTAEPDGQARAEPASARRQVIVLRADPGEQHRERLDIEFPDLEFALATTPAELSEVLEAAVALIGGSSLTAELLAGAPHLRWVQATSAGIENFLIPELRDRSTITLTNFSGIAAPNIAEHVLALILAFARGLKPLLEDQGRHAWPKDNPAVQQFEVTGQTLGIVGMGDIGHEVAQRAHALGMRVIGTQRHQEEPPPYVERLLPSEGLDELLSTADHVVLCLPLTRETRKTIGAEELARMRQSAYLYNIGRGDLVDQEALVLALREGHIAGAGLDVTTPEPLPPESPLWALPNVLITGHTAGETPRYWDRGIELLIDNVHRFLAGESLRNTVDTQAGY